MEDSPLYTDLMGTFMAHRNALCSSQRVETRPILQGNHPKSGRKGVLAKTKPLARSNLASEDFWRPKQPQIICLKKSGRSFNLLSTSFNLPEKIRMFFCQRVFFSQQTKMGPINHLGKCSKRWHPPLAREWGVWGGPPIQRGDIKRSPPPNGPPQVS